MLQAWLIAIALVVVTVVIHYESLRLLSGHLEALKLPVRVRVRMILVLLAIFATHIAEVLIFAAGFMFASHVLGLGTLVGDVGPVFRDFVYFSVSSYTSLGLGDIFPTGGLRLLTGIEALIGLLMITWSASFTFLYMQKFWRLGRADGDA